MNSSYTENMLSKNDFEKFLSESMTVAEDRVFRELVDERFHTILINIFEKCGITFDSYNYDNLYYDDEEECFFDVNTFSTNVNFKVQFNTINPKFNLYFFKYKDKFPTKWFYTDFQEELSQAINTVFLEQAKVELEAQLKDKQAKDAILELNEAKTRILEIVPQELWKYISFVSVKDLQHNIGSQVTKEYQKRTESKIRDMKVQGISISTKYKDYKNNGGELKFDKWFEELHS